jgi:uncharacterized membrane protein
VSTRRLRQVGIALTLLAYAALEQYSNRAGAPAALGAALAIAPLLLALGILAGQTPRPALALSLLLLISVLLLPTLWQRIERHYAPLYLLQQCGIILTLAAVFGSTLLAGRTPLCTQWALRVHGPLDARVQRYTRGVTLAWAFFFVGIAAVDAVLYATVARTTWSLFANFLILPLAALLFAAEYQLRRRRLPMMPRATLSQMLSAYVASPRGSRRS